MKEGIVPVPPNTPPLRVAMMIYYLFGVIAFGGGHSCGGETPVSVKLVLSHFSKSYQSRVLCPVPHREYKSNSYRNSQKETYKEPK